MGPWGDRETRWRLPLGASSRARRRTVAALTVLFLAALWPAVARSAPAPPQPPRPASADRLLVIAPHCDDETLATGGLLAQTKAGGGAVRVVLITNGDGFHYAAERLFGGPNVSPVDYMQLGLDRQAETLAAMSELGIEPSAISFLGYPDGGTDAMWLTHWDPAQPYTSPLTLEDHSPYPNAFTRATPFAGRSVIADLKRIITEFRPTAIALPHPNDLHPDHWAAYCYTIASLYELDLLGRVRLEHYLVHRGSWPQPRGLHARLPLQPPPELVSRATRWRTLPLEPALVRAKTRAIGRYRTQLMVMRGFLLAFARTNELFGTVPFSRLPRVAPDAIRIDGSPADWQGIAPQIIDSREKQTRIPASLDLGDVQIAANDRHLLLRAELWDAPDPDGEYIVHLHPLAPRAVEPPLSYTFRPREPRAEDYAFGTRSLEVALPASRAIGPAGVMLAVETRRDSRTVDRTAWALLRSPGSPH